MPRDAKTLGAYFTPEAVADALVRWAARRPEDLLLDPSSGDGRFVARHPNSVGVERDPASVAEASERAPDASVVHGDFFTWASDDRRQFDCAAGNPPFIRYQRFSGAIRQAALDYCRRLGVTFSALSSSWAPFIVAAASKLRAGGRIAFVVPAEIGHAPYAAPLVEYLLAHFGSVHVVAIREKIFPRLAEDCWLLFADKAGGRATGIRLSKLDRFTAEMPPAAVELIPAAEWRVRWGSRLRPFLLPPRVRSIYGRVAADPGAVRLGHVAQVGIGYVSGANQFFHLRPSDAQRLAIPDDFLLPSIRSSRYVTGDVIDDVDLERWIARNEPVLLLRIPPGVPVPAEVQAYLDTVEGRRARGAYKCRNRRPWYTVPDVRRPAFVITYMSGTSPTLAMNRSRCTCTNALLAVDLRSGLFQNGNGWCGQRLSAAWDSPAGRLSCEIEGHPLGGGLLKLEPGEARNVVLVPAATVGQRDGALLNDGVEVMRRWRHVA